MSHRPLESHRRLYVALDRILDSGVLSFGSSPTGGWHQLSSARQLESGCASASTGCCPRSPRNLCARGANTCYKTTPCVHAP